MSKKMKVITMLGFFLLTSTSLTAQNLILGQWHTGQEHTIIEVIETEGKIEGRIVESSNAKVPIGKFILKDVYSHAEGVKGKLYSLRKNKWFEATLSPRSNEMQVTIAAGLAKRTVVWKRKE